MKTVATLLLICLLAVSFQFKSQQKAANATVQEDLAYAFNGEVQVSILDEAEMEQIEGKGAPLIAVVIVQGGRMIVQRWVSPRVAASIARAGGDLWAPSRQAAKALARAIGSRRPIREFHSGSGTRFTHYHANPRNGSHIWYGSPRTYGFGAATIWGGFSGSSFFGGSSSSNC